MNATQKNILKAALATVTVTALFPPFIAQAGMGRTYGLGFGFILSWPNFEGHAGTVDVALLLVEWLAIALLCGVLWALSRDPKAPSVIDRLLRAMVSNNDGKMEAARIHADSVIRAAEISTSRSAQMDVLDHQR